MKRRKRAVSGDSRPLNAGPAVELRAALSPAVKASMSLKQWAYGDPDIEVNDILAGLISQLEAVALGNMAGPENMLLSQAAVLDAMFHKLSHRGLANVGQFSDSADTYLRLAFRAQNLCRENIEALGMLKAPKPLTARFTQINQRIKRDETKTQRAAIGVDPSLETLVEDHRAENGSGQGEGVTQRVQKRRRHRAAASAAQSAEANGGAR